MLEHTWMVPGTSPKRSQLCGDRGGVVGLQNELPELCQLHMTKFLEFLRLFKNKMLCVLLWKLVPSGAGAPDVEQSRLIVTFVSD